MSSFTVSCIHIHSKMQVTIAAHHPEAPRLDYLLHYISGHTPERQCRWSAISTLVIHFVIQNAMLRIAIEAFKSCRSDSQPQAKGRLLSALMGYSVNTSIINWKACCCSLWQRLEHKNCKSKTLGFASIAFLIHIVCTKAMNATWLHDHIYKHDDFSGIQGPEQEWLWTRYRRDHKVYQTNTWRPTSWNILVWLTMKRLTAISFSCNKLIGLISKGPL